MARFVNVVRTNLASGQLNSVGGRTTLIAGSTNVSGVPDGTYGVIIGLLTCNKNSNTRTFSLELIPSGTTTTGLLVHNVNIPNGTSLELIEGDKIIMNAGDTLSAYSNGANSLDCQVSYMLNVQDNEI
jgi:hypothetical protein